MRIGKGGRELQDCKLVITVKDDSLRFDSEGVGMEELACMSVFMQGIIGEQLVNQGQGMDGAKDALWDLYLDAVRILEDRKGDMGTWQLRNVGG
ncbi:hypothetical protein D3Z42_16585 [Lachnospiraceae bacterium]|nr:hypothetical protein [Lachnospiraceae bacterium]NBI77022.1 hypothetical protein [Lachnospiraceae bacterium]